VIELYKHQKLVKTQKFDSTKLKQRLLDAINNPKHGIRTLTGESRKSLRLDLVRTIYALRSSVSRWKLGSNIIIEGESGSGKTKAANVIGFVYAQMGVMATDRFSDVTTTSLISDHVGGTAKLTEEKLLDSLESTILIDEIYRTNSKCDKPSSEILAELEGRIPASKETPSPFGMEAITQMVAMLAELRGLLVVIVAGYAPNIKCWLTSNDGLERRFLTTVELHDYTPKDFTNMFMIRFKSILKDDDLNLTAAEEQTVTNYVQELFTDILKNDKNLLKRQAGDVDIIAAYFATSLGERYLLQLSWPDDVLYIVLMAFHRFLRRSKARWYWEPPAMSQQLKSKSKSKSTSKRTGGVRQTTQTKRFNAFQNALATTTRIHCYTPDSRLYINL